MQDFAKVVMCTPVHCLLTLAALLTQGSGVSGSTPFLRSQPYLILICLRHQAEVTSTGYGVGLVLGHDMGAEQLKDLVKS